jgi:hypothetical protein
MIIWSIAVHIQREKIGARYGASITSALDAALGWTGSSTGRGAVCRCATEGD